MFKSVTLYTDQLAAMRRFYGNILELEITERADDRFTVRFGATDVTFVSGERPACYHFAINIPGNQFSMLKYWIQDRVPLNWEDGVDEVYFRAFDADSMYFEDPAGNVVELIGRRKKDVYGDITRSSFLNISEVGLVTGDVWEAGQKLFDAGLPLRGTDLEPDELNFIGSGDSYFVLVPHGRRWYFSKKDAEIHPLTAVLTDGTEFRLDTVGNISFSNSGE
ncbi:ring-cleaving dioxygenase [Bhargavaea massiliensis]|uniref:ring-cleaving dioxygenase n=1 Tax=Bhargavaea massiliensis TaxID=2697500 RepID=UPI001BCBCB33|nr:ring-cleaving dioxygenase [Bhargavaea massiliensis]